MQATTNRKRERRAPGVAPGPRLFIMAAVVVLASLLPAAQVAAADISVDSDCSLANAIREANGAAQSGSQNNCEAGTDGSGAAGADTITLTRDVTLSATPPEITSDIIIDGGGYTISGQDRHRIYFQGSGAVRLENLNLLSGRTNYSGGAILLIGGSLTLDKVSVTDSVASGSGGGILSESAILIIRDSFFGNNLAGYGGGAISFATHTSGASSIENSTFFGNRAGWGGAIYASGNPNDEPFTLSHVTITGNSETTGNELDYAGGIESATGVLRVYNSILYGNGEFDCHGTALSAGAGNIIGANGCGGSPSTDDPLLPAGLTRPEDGSPSYFALVANSPAVNNAVDDHCLATDQRGVSRPYPADGKCDIGAYEYGGAPPARQPRQDSPPILNQNPPPQDENPPPQNNPPPVNQDPPPDDEDPNSGRRPRDSGPESRRVAPTPAPSTCLTLPPEIVVSNIVNETQCQTVRTDAGIGNAAIVKAGYLDAVDVWGTVPANVQVCFRAISGRFVFLDALLPSPRVASDLAARSADGWTCTSISSAGTVVLMPPQDESFSNCSVTTTGALNLRAEPYGEVLGLVPEGTTLAATARSSGYLQVSHGGRTGWISEAYVTTSGSCG